MRLLFKAMRLHVFPISLNSNTGLAIGSLWMGPEVQGLEGKHSCI